MRRVTALLALVTLALSAGQIVPRIVHAGADPSASPTADETTRQILQRYIDSAHTDLSMMADDVEFIVLATGQRARGIDEVRGMLDYFYRGAFEATAELHSLVVENDRAVVEGDLVGVHRGEFAGIPATGKTVRVPVAVAYDLEEG